MTIMTLHMLIRLHNCSASMSLTSWMVKNIELKYSLKEDCAYLYLSSK